MTHGVHTTEHPVQPTGTRPPAHGLPRQSSGIELARRDHSVLARGNSGDNRVSAVLGAFVTHTVTKAPLALN
jgi:hypothetical protein